MAAGLNELPESDHPERMLKFACETFTVIKNYNTKNIEEYIRQCVEDAEHHHTMPHQINIRVGVNTGMFKF